MRVRQAVVVSVLAIIGIRLGHAQDATSVRAATGSPSCAQSVRASGVKDPSALRAALHQCQRARAAERKATPEPVIVEGRGISAPAD